MRSGREGYDARKRERERRGIGGDLDARGDHLKERVRSGELTEGRLQLAAYLGDVGAIRALGEEEKAKKKDMHTPLWVADINKMRSLSQGEREEALVRAAVAAARKVLEKFETVVPDDTRPRRAIEAAEEWILIDQQDRDSVSNTAYDAQAAAALAARSAGDVTKQAFAARSARVAARCASITGIAVVVDASAAVAHAFAAGGVELDEAIRDELIPWVLEEGKDPVEERVETRKKEK